MEVSKEMTAERILSSALQLMRDKGFKAVTIKEIAMASEVSEMTVMRHFETKKNVLEAAVKKNSHNMGTKFKEIFESEMVWELEQDLKLIAMSYLSMMEKNQSVCLIAIQERFTMPEMVSAISENTGRLKHLIVKYFEEMQKKEKMKPVEAHAQATSFITALFGFFISTSLWGTQFIKESKEDFVNHHIEVLCNGLKK